MEDGLEAITLFLDDLDFYHDLCEEPIGTCE